MYSEYTLKGSVNFIVETKRPKKSKSEKKYLREYLKIISTSKGEKQKMLLEDLIKKSQSENVDIVKCILEFKSSLEREIKK